MITPTATAPSTNNNQTKRAGKGSNQSLNHLLNFSLPPRQSQYNQSIPRRARRTGNQHGIWNKERFVNAQYRFVMNPTGDYTVHFADPDIYFQWHDILQIIVPRGNQLSATSASQEAGILTCPICLSPPTAPRMTKCGHIFCFPCILHLISTSDQPKWVRCPICFDSVNERQLKAVKWLDEVPSPDDADDTPAEGSSSSATLDQDFSTTPRSGSMLRMRLIQRPQITTLALPRSSTWPSDLLPPHQAPYHFLPDVFAFSKFMLATPADLIQDLTKDLDDLATERRLLAGMGDELGTVFIDAADAKVRHQIEKAAALDTPHLRESIETARHAAQQLHERRVKDHQRKVEPAPVPSDEVPQAFLATQGPGYANPTPAPRESAPTPTGRNPRQRRNINPPPPSTSTYYYYQAASGMPIFLHPLDIKILLSHFHSYAAFPDTISIKVESYTESTVNDDLRKRCKYLAHLPEGADVVFVEADLEGVVGADGLRPFEGALRLRRSRRKEKGRKDDKARARAEEREKERLVQTYHDFGISPPAAPAFSAPVEFEFEQEPSAAAPEAEPVSSSPPEPSGAWGARSFASAAHAAQGRAQGQRAPASAPPRRERVEDEWELDMAFHELEQRTAKGGGKKRGNKLVVLGGGGGRRAR
ncbi:hypothetical protein PYCCODRAFT_1434440 [Trametes coccinea BRFM310]|uniref:RING-type domain-containing protein n=1 Tax=Trametes coccinea (strain BRFM310) TaxID=1353009 RepID=A0A1Y2IUB8_TRAC3|nr:hypothetical protein PYCCODRAFT_1434440 [Trametes coccinea BRFM310]